MSALEQTPCACRVTDPLAPPGWAYLRELSLVMCPLHAHAEALRDAIAAISAEWAKKSPDEGVLDALIAQAETVLNTIEGTR